MNRVRVNADDYGLHPDINRGIVACVDRDVVQSVSLAPLGKAVDWAQAKTLSERVGVGVHITLTGERWATNDWVIPSWSGLLHKILFGGRNVPEAIEREMRHQVELCIENGIRPDHINGHQHVHIFPKIWWITLELAREFGIEHIRIPSTPSRKISRQSLGGRGLQSLAMKRARDLPAYRQCIGIAHSGHNTIEIIERELAAAKGKDIELVVHPGFSSSKLAAQYGTWSYDWDAEREMLLNASFPRVLSEHGFEMG